MKLRVMTYNIHGCKGMDGRYSHERIAEVIERYEPDVVALQEVDSGRERSQLVDQARAIAELLEMDAHFHAALRVEKEEYGDAILSRHPMRLVKAGALPGVPRQFINESRGALWVSIPVGHGAIQFINTHFGLGRNERRVQAQALLGPDWIGAARADSPVIVCGDFNSPPRRVVHGMFTSTLRDCQLAAPGARLRNTFATTFPFICLDYVFVSDEFEVTGCDVPRTPLTRVASDHYPLIVDLIVPERVTGDSPRSSAC